MPTPRLYASAALILIAATSAMRAEEAEKLVANPEYAAWAKSPKGTTVRWSKQKVNVMDVARTIGPMTVESISENEIVLTDTFKVSPSGTIPDRKIPSRIAASALPKDEATDKKDERKLTDGTTITCKMVLRKVAGQPDMKVWLSDDVPGGVVEREWEEGKHGTIVEKLTAFKFPGKPEREFEKPAPAPGTAHPIDPEPPSMQDVEKAKSGGPNPVPQNVPPTK